ncbi:MAG: thioredoxin domain-containing protein, partial [Casimicrobiaceae bacterium]
MKLVAALLALLACTAPGFGQSEPAGAAARSGGWRLADATSPYLRAHADNPVDWYPWGPEAFARAKELDRPIFLSIGYSACHWCHRMEHDTFENAECARQLNELFVCIKVDREERPDIDSRYMQALQIITGSGGWPASLFLTSDGQAFAGGTYFPPDDTPEGPGLKSLLARVSELWTTQRAAVLEASRDLNDVLLRDPLSAPPPAAPVDVADAAPVPTEGADAPAAPADVADAPAAPAAPATPAAPDLAA